MTLFGKQITVADLTLACAGVLGAVCFFWLLPPQHPGSAADYSLSEDAAVSNARRFVERNGFVVTDDARRLVYAHKNAALLDGLQAEEGRPRAVRLLEGEAGTRLPGHHWHVRWQLSSEQEDERQLDVLLTQEGRVYDLDAEGAGSWIRSAETVNRDALRAALGRTQERRSRERSRPDTAASAVPLSAPDSLLRRYLTFDFSAPADSLKSSEDAQTAEALAEILKQHTGPTSQVFNVPSLNQADAVQMARYHLRQTALRDYTFRLDTLYTSEVAGLNTATVRLWGSAFHGQRPRVEMELTAAGALLRLDTQFDHEGLPPTLADTAPDSPFYQPPQSTAGETGEDGEQAGNEGGSSISLNIGSDTGAGIVTGIMYVLLVGLSIFLFVRRVTARVVDVKSALQDALWGGFFAGGMIVAMMASILFQDAEFWMAVLGLFIIGLFTAAGGAFLIFLASGAMDSLARAEWPEKVTTLTLLRHGALRNVPVGQSLLRGLAAAFALLGLTTLLMVAFPQAILHYSAAADNTPPMGLLLSYFGFLFGAGAWTAQFIGLTVLLGVGTWLYRRRPSVWWVVPGLTVVLVLLQVGVVMIAPLGFHALFLTATGAGLAWVFWRYDFVVAFVALLFASLLWGTADGWMNAQAPTALDALLALGCVGGVFVIGLVGLWSGRTSTEVPDYTPAYIEELAEQERLQRDIEIAQQVQRDFLPRRMPQVEGVEMAALCLPAREVGGDYYDVIPLSGGRLGVVIGDVSGKGIEASFYMTLAKGFLQTLATEERSPAEVLCRLNTLFCRNASRGTFITMIYGIVDPAEGTFRFARAGHNPLMYRRVDEEVETTGSNGRAQTGSVPSRPAPPCDTYLLRPRGLAIGLVDGARFDEVIDEVKLPLHPGDALVLYTDGFPEARGTDGDEFGEERLRERVQGQGHRPAQQLLQTLADDVHAFVESAGRHDDMTMVVIKRTVPAGGDTDARAVPSSTARRSS